MLFEIILEFLDNQIFYEYSCGIYWNANIVKSKQLPSFSCESVISTLVPSFFFTEMIFMDKHCGDVQELMFMEAQIINFQSYGFLHWLLARFFLDYLLRLCHHLLFGHLADYLSWFLTQICKLSVAQYESDLLSVVHSLILSISESGLQSITLSPCCTSCMRFYLVKLMRLSGYDAGVCVSKWQGNGKVPGGMSLNIIVAGFTKLWFYFHIVVCC